MSDAPLRVLIVDDQAPVVKALQVLLDIHGIPNIAAASPDEACRIAAAETLGAVVQDMNYSASETSGDEGAKLFRSLRAIDPHLPILLMTAWASLETAVELVREGAADYLQKPWDDNRLVASLRNLVTMRQLELENARLRSEIGSSREALAAGHDLCGIVYASPAMHRVVALAVSVAASDAPVLITGPSGSGKERVAEIVQANSRRRGAALVRVNVGAIPDELLESELFGAEAGAYTGITQRRIGHFETANRGTLFLDEVDSLSLGGQVKLLRVLQSGELRRLGSSTSRQVDVRVISATNADLGVAVADGRFREDLFYRLNVVELAVPALARRGEDILPLARHFLRIHSARPPDQSLELGAAAERALLGHAWPGNVRELENRIQRATVVAAQATVSPRDLGLNGDDDSQAPGPPAQPLSPEDASEREVVLGVLGRAGGVVAHAAAELGVSRQALYRRMARLGIEIERRPREG